MPAKTGGSFIKRVSIDNPKGQNQRTAELEWLKQQFFENVPEGFPDGNCRPETLLNQGQNQRTAELE